MAKRTRFGLWVAALGCLAAACADVEPDESCDDGVWQGDVRIRDEADLARLAGCHRIEGNLYVSQTSLEHLEPLGQLDTVTATVSIVANPLLTNLDGLRRLRHIGGCLELNRNPLIEDLDALAGLEAIELCLIIGQDDELSEQYGNGSLSNIDGLAAVEQLRRFVVIEGNPELGDLDGLHALESVGGSLTIRANRRLARLNALETLAELGGERFEVAQNPLLPACQAEALADRLAGQGFAGEVSIHGNDDEAGCPP